LAEDISVSAEAILAAGIAFIAKFRLVFLQTHLRITYKIYDLDDDGGGVSGGSSLAEHESKLRL
jgi:hypothetical protein